MGGVSTTFPRREEEDDGPGPPAARTCVDGDVAGKDWDKGCPRCGGCPGGAAATPAAPHPRLDPADPEDPEEEGFTLEEEEEDDLLDFPGIAEGKSAKSSSSPGKEEEVRESGWNPAGVAKASHRGSPGSLEGFL